MAALVGMSFLAYVWADERAMLSETCVWRGVEPLAEVAISCRQRGIAD